MHAPSPVAFPVGVVCNWRSADGVITSTIYDTGLTVAVCIAGLLLIAAVVAVASRHLRAPTGRVRRMDTYTARLLGPDGVLFAEIEGISLVAGAPAVTLRHAVQDGDVVTRYEFDRTPTHWQPGWIAEYIYITATSDPAAPSAVD
ncbi:hypothetical protein [Orlajensenia leifsoniae]|uniref:Uncharacterized protein n=1 Tax=Orlajensenia leifsoniae TaxID=2561933 RepID=A0A4Y9R788_9MICO|nr:hypothetical protein [Leifsonia flava]TFW00191.1 hypothetical protein E4M00_03115 [Leifsonia flava]